MSVKDGDKTATVDIARRLRKLGFRLHATRGTAAFLRQQGVEVETVNKVAEGRPHIVDHIKNREAHLVLNTVGTASSQADSAPSRREALQQGIPYFTTIQGVRAAVTGIEATAKVSLTVQPLQEYHPTQA